RKPERHDYHRPLNPRLARILARAWHELAQSVRLGVVMTCETCGADPCINPSFCRACREADARKAHGESPRYIEPSLWRRPSDNIPDNWQNMSIEGLIAHFDRARRRHSASQATVEALMYSLCSRGTKALEEPASKRRLSLLNETQLRA